MSSISGTGHLKSYPLLIAEQNKSRNLVNLSPLEYAQAPESGKDVFYLETKFHYGKLKVGYPFHFTKAAEHWKYPREDRTRAYITINPRFAGDIQKHFIRLTSTLYDHGIDFDAKSASPKIAVRETDNIVYYVASGQIEEATSHIISYLKEYGIGQGHIPFADSFPYQGLSLAKLTEEHEQLYKDISGSSKISYNSFQAALFSPLYLDMAAKLYEREGESSSARKFKEESARVATIIKAANIKLPYACPPFT